MLRSLYCPNQKLSAMQGKYLNPLNDFGFKKLFGEESNQHLLVSFLNTVLLEYHQIKDLQCIQKKYQVADCSDQDIVFDLNCVSTSGDHFVVQLQKVKRNHFKDRSIYYSTFPMYERAEKMDAEPTAIYIVNILDFIFEDGGDSSEVIQTVQLKGKSGKVFDDQLTFIYLTLPHFKKTETELETDRDKWFFIFRYLHELNAIPEALQTDTFKQLFEIAEIACLDKNERQAYINSLKYYHDLKHVTDTAWEEGKKRGLRKVR